MLIRVLKFAGLAAVVMLAACSNDGQRALTSSPVSPSELGVGGGGVSRRALVTFPDRADGLDFRRQLETKYATGLGRPVSQVFVDMEGEVVWIQEYDRYRVNGCDHTTATQYALQQVDGAAPSPVCSLRQFPETANYPPRDEVVDFRRQLGNKYQSMGRSAQSSVDANGAATWISEYLRYRTSGCDHATATQNTMTQIDGNAPPATCLARCEYAVTSPNSIAAAGGTFVTDVERRSGSCDYVALSESPWLTLARPISGSGRGVLTYNAAANSGPPRTGWIRIQYPDGAAYLEVRQGSLNLSFQLFDPATSTSPTTECLLRTTRTTCTVTAATQNLANPVATYSWRVQYAYGGTKILTQSGASPTFSFFESCGASDSAGTPIPLLVELTAIDTAGNSVTLVSGQGTQPALQLRYFSCP